jgi:hypothetical protein
MNAQWQVRRTLSAQDAGQQRWDLAYQCLLYWIEDDSRPHRPQADAKETHDGGRPVCTGLNPAPTTDPDH